MHDATETAFVQSCTFFTKHLDRIVRCLAGMDDQWFATGTGSGDMRAKPVHLPFLAGFNVVIVEAGFTDSDDLRMHGQFDEGFDVGLFNVFRPRMRHRQSREDAHAFPPKLLPAESLPD